MIFLLFNFFDFLRFKFCLSKPQFFRMRGTSQSRSGGTRTLKGFPSLVEDTQFAVNALIRAFFVCGSNPSRVWAKSKLASAP